MDEKWVSAKELIEALGGNPNTGGSDEAVAVAKRAYAGLLPCRAKRYFSGTTAAQDDCPVPALFWSAEGQAGLVQDWVRGDFAWADVNPIRLKVFGAEFSKASAIEMGAEFTPKRKGIGGAPVQQDKWDLFWMTVLTLMHDGRLNASVFPSPKDLREEVLDLMQSNGHGKDTIDPKVKQIWERFANA